jgi:hypothetical protein
MCNSQVHRNFWLAFGAAALLIVAGCSNTTSNEPTTTAKKVDPVKPAATAKTDPAAKAPQPTTMVTVPKGTAISATIGQTLATDKNKVGDTFAASLTTPIQVEGKTVIPKGAHVTGRIVKVKKNEMKVMLASVVIRGKSYQLETNSVAGSKSQAKDNGKDTDKTKVQKGVTLLTAKSQLKFKLAKSVTIPVKG